MDGLVVLGGWYRTKNHRDAQMQSRQFREGKPFYTATVYEGWGTWMQNYDEKGVCLNGKSEYNLDYKQKRPQYR